MKKAMIILLVSILTSICLVVPAISHESIKVTVDGEYLSFDVPPATINNRTLVPLRKIFEALGAETDWNSSAQTIVGVKEGLEVSLSIGNDFALRNGAKLKLDAPAVIIDGRTLVPVRFIAESLGAQVAWHDASKTVTILNKGLQKEVRKETIQPKSYNKDLTIGNKKIKLNVIEIPAGSNLKPVVGIGQNRIGKTEEMASIAKRHGAIAAINGGYFQAYDSKVPMDPYGTLITNGKLIHKGSIGSTIGFTENGSIKLDTLIIKIEGSTDNSYTWPNNWYAYGINHTPSPGGSSVFIYTPERGERLGFAFGTNVVVSHGKVLSILKNTDVLIPSNGFVINFLGGEEKLLDRFKLGSDVDYKLSYKNMDDLDLDWTDVITAVGAGPLLIKNGRIIANPEAEGFFEDKILTSSFNRSAIGVKPDNTIFLVTTSSATITELASAMEKLGAINAMCLDGGGSSGLYFNGAYLWTPGRHLSNVLMFVPEK